MKRRSVIVVGAVAAIGLSVYFFVNRADDVGPGAAAANGVVDRMQANNRTVFEKPLGELKTRLREARASLASSGGVDEALQLRVKLLKDAFAKMHDANRMLARDELRGQIMDSLLAEPGYLEIVTDVVTDWKYAESLFGTEQALARISSLEIVKRSAEHGDTAPIQTALAKLGDKLNEPEKWEKGIQHDYVDLVAGYINTLDTEKFLAEPQAFFDLVKLSERTSNEIAKGIYDSKLRAFSQDVLRERLGRYLGPAPEARL